VRSADRSTSKAGAAPATVSKQKERHYATVLRHGKAPPRVPHPLASPETGLKGVAMALRRVMPGRWALDFDSRLAASYPPCALRELSSLRGCAREDQNMRCHRIPAVLLPLAPLSCCPLFAAEEPAELEPIVVTATRTAQTADEALASVTVITREEIERRQVQSVQEVLRGVPGLHITNSGGLGKETSVFLRGYEFRPCARPHRRDPRRLRHLREDGLAIDPDRPGRAHRDRAWPAR
jgi:vitamin B12 transporter